MKTIGVDLTPIQGPHRMRGVGSTAINVMRHLSDEDRSRYHFVLYLYKNDQQEALDIVNASALKSYEVRTVPPATAVPASIKTLHGLLHIPRRLANALLNRKLGDKRITDIDGVDFFLQFEQDVLPPPQIPSVVIAYDLIPYVLEGDYLWSYRTARNTHNYSRRGALKAHVKRYAYLSKIRSVMHRAQRVVAISEHTKNDFVKYMGIAENKIDVVHLGISSKESSNPKRPDFIERYVNSSWGDIKVHTKLSDKPFLLFVGGADPRRKINELVYAFNLLRAQGHDIILVLAGDTMLGPNSVPNADARKALLSSSYLDDIYMLGFVDDDTREWLYQNALVFVYPSIYEGFGLPVVEAMQYGTPVITYDNSSIKEVAGNLAHYAEDFTEIAALTQRQLTSQNSLHKEYKQRIQHANKYSWSLSAKNIFEKLPSN